jgi:hypothetical protein
VRPFTPTVQACRLGIQTHVGRSPLLYQLLHRARAAPRSRNLVGPATDLCIEAPSGSGNSVFVRSFQIANPDVSVAHHHHVAAQVKRSVAFGVPTLVILRNPIDCSVSRSREAPWMVGPVLPQWIHFFRAVESLESSVLRLSFELVTREPGAAVQRVNERFSRAFDTDLPDAEHVFARMDAGWRVITGGDDSEHNPNRPDPTAEELRKRVRPRAEAHPLAAPALELYERLRTGLR